MSKSCMDVWLFTFPCPCLWQLPCSEVGIVTRLLTSWIPLTRKGSRLHIGPKILTVRIQKKTFIGSTDFGGRIMWVTSNFHKLSCLSNLYKKNIVYGYSQVARNHALKNSCMYILFYNLIFFIPSYFFFLYWYFIR